MTLSVMRGGMGDVAAPPFKCNSTICYGSDGGRTHALFKELQYQMNRAGQAIFGPSWKSIKVDGFVGKDTLAGAKTLFPKIIGTAQYAGAPSFAVLAEWVSKMGSAIPDALRKAADDITRRPESSAQIQNRQEAAAAEGPAKGSTPAGPNVTVPKPVVTIPGSSQVPGSYASGTPQGAPAGSGFVWVIAGVAAVGLVATAALVARKRRRRR